MWIELAIRRWTKTGTGAAILPRPSRIADRMKTAVCLTAIVYSTSGHAADVPDSPFINSVYRYADTMLQKGRDVFGPQKTGLFLSALDRHSLLPLTVRPAPPAGIRRGDRVGPPWDALVGANPQHDQNFLRVLYVLSGTSGESKYKDAADAELKWFLSNAASPETNLLAWGEHMYWNTQTDRPNPTDASAVHEFSRPWVLWDRCFELEPEASEKFALALWEHQIDNHKNGGFDRHAAYWKHGPRDSMDFPRHAGFYIRTWADAYSHTDNTVFLQAIETLLSRYESKRHPQTGLIEHRRGNPIYSSAQMLSLSIDCAAAARRVPESLAVRLTTLVDREDEIFCSWNHNLSETGGFVIQAEKATGKPSEPHSSCWDAHYGAATTAMLGMMCVSRYENSGKIGYRDLVTAAADAYLESDPPEGTDVWPMTFGHVISVELAAWRSTTQRRYLDRARELAYMALDVFFQDRALPRASMKTGHYETITGADTLALALVEVHLASLHITAVTAPDNTIDR